MLEYWVIMLAFQQKLCLRERGFKGEITVDSDGKNMLELRGNILVSAGYDYKAKVVETTEQI